MEHPSSPQSRHQGPEGKYRGRRRVQTTPGRRYLAVLTTAFLGATLVALGAGAAMPGHAGALGLASADSSAELGDRVIAEGPASRNERSRADTATFDQPAPDVWLLPVNDYHVTSGFKFRWGRPHNGIDMAAAEGTPMFAAARGKVTVCRFNGGFGNNVQIDHGKGVTTVYGHAAKLFCREGQIVEAGQKIALVGNTGHSFGAHLHFEVRQKGKPIEPTAFMRKHGVDIMTHAQAIYGDQISD